MQHGQILKKLSFDPNPLIRGWGSGRVLNAKHLLPFCDSFNWICNMTRFWKSWSLTYWSHSQGGGVGAACGQNIYYHVPAFVMLFSLKCNMTILWKSWSLTYWPYPQGRGGGSAGKNICYHVGAFVILFNLICNMTLFWKSWIFTYWFHPQGREMGRGVWVKTFATMLLHLWYSLIRYATWLYSEKLNFDPSGRGWGSGRSLRTKYLLPCCRISWFPLNGHATWQCFEKVEI